VRRHQPGRVPGTAAGWDIDFSAETKALTLIRQQRIPGAGGHPLCPACGEMIERRPDFHHRKRRGPGDGRPSNCIAVHGRFEGDQCHFRLIHDQTASARANGWIIVASAPLRAYRMPMMVNFRQDGIDPNLPWVVLDDWGGWRQAKTGDLAGDYEAVES
jgi:hypothetical protein